MSRDNNENYKLELEICKNQVIRKGIGKRESLKEFFNNKKGG